DELPDEQTPDDEKSLCFDSEAVAISKDIVGAPRIKLSVASDKTVGQLAIRLCDLRSDGTSALITYGVFNLTHHTSHQKPEPLEPGKPVKIDFALDQIAYRLPEGHKLRVAISTAYWPTIWPLQEAFELSLNSGSLSLPVRQMAENDEWSFQEPEGAEPWKREELRPASYSRTTQTSAETGIVTTAVDCDFGENRDLAHGLVSGSSMKERWTIHPDDPLSAKVQTEWEQTGGREGTMWRTHVLAEMTADAENYNFRALLTAFEGEETVNQQMYEDSVPRQ
ncbi:MAG: CocE/NonD family hydrolase C-terminal non-catalytic domain-containing protein, partial [Rhizobiaceae bacterium]